MASQSASITPEMVVVLSGGPLAQPHEAKFSAQSLVVAVRPPCKPQMSSHISVVVPHSPQMEAGVSPVLLDQPQVSSDLPGVLLVGLGVLFVEVSEPSQMPQVPPGPSSVSSEVALMVSHASSLSPHASQESVHRPLAGSHQPQEPLHEPSVTSHLGEVVSESPGLRALSAVKSHESSRPVGGSSLSICSSVLVSMFSQIVVHEPLVESQLVEMVVHPSLEDDGGSEVSSVALDSSSSDGEESSASETASEG